MKKNSKLNLNQDVKPTGNMVDDLLLNLMGTLSTISLSLEDIATELSIQTDNDNIRMVNEGFLTQEEVDERESPDEK